MSLTTLTFAPVPSPEAEHPTPYGDTLHELIAIGMDVAREIRHQIGDTGIAEVATAFDRLSRAVRRTVHLACRLAETPTPAEKRTAARRRIIRDVENAIERQDNPAAAPALRAELDEHLDDPVLDEDIDARPIADIITDICRDLGVAIPMPGLAFRRRTPDEIRALARRAMARPAARAPATPPSRDEWPGWHVIGDPLNILADNDPAPPRQAGTPPPSDA